MNNEEYLNIIEYLKTGQFPLKIKELSQASQYRLKLKCDKYKIVKGVLYTQNNIPVVPENKKMNI